MTNKIVGDYARLSFPEHYRKLEIARAGEIARAEELARIEARREHETVPAISGSNREPMNTRR